MSQPASPSGSCAVVPRLTALSRSGDCEGEAEPKLSGVYAMGGMPIMALAVAGMPVAGSHTIVSSGPIYGLAAMRLMHPSRIKRNADGRPGDILILSKRLGIGILSAAIGPLMAPVRLGRGLDDILRTLLTDPQNFRRAIGGLPPARSGRTSFKLRVLPRPL